jgi:hypothetical protein
LPCQRDHPGLDLPLEIVQVRPQHRPHDGNHLLADALDLALRKHEAIVKGLELLILQEHHARLLRDRHGHSLQAAALSDELQDLSVEVYAELARLWMPDD